MSGIAFQHKEAALTQVGGAFTLTVSPDTFFWQVAVEINGGTAGTLAIAVKPVDGNDFSDLQSTIDMINGPTIVFFDGNYKEVRFTPTGFNGTDYDLIVTGRKD